MTNPNKKERLTDVERHKRFKAMAKETGADDAPEAFERAFTKVVTHPKKKP